MVMNASREVGSEGHSEGFVGGDERLQRTVNGEGRSRLMVDCWNETGLD